MASRDMPPALADLPRQRQADQRRRSVDTTGDRQPARHRPQRGGPAQQRYPAQLVGVSPPAGTSFDLGGVDARADRDRRLQQQVADPRHDQQTAIVRTTCRRRSSISSASSPTTTSSSTACSALGLEFGDEQDPLDQPLYPRHAEAGAAGHRHSRPTHRLHSARAGHGLVRAPADRHAVGRRVQARHSSVSTCAAAMPIRKREAPDELSASNMSAAIAPRSLWRLFHQSPQQWPARQRDGSFSDLNEDLWSGGARPVLQADAEASRRRRLCLFGHQARTERRDFQFSAPSDFPIGVALLRPDICSSQRSSRRSTSAWSRRTKATRRSRRSCATHAGYAKINADLGAGHQSRCRRALRDGQADGQPGPGVRARRPARSPPPTSSTTIGCPAATLTWEFAPGHAAPPQRVEDDRAAAVPRTGLPAAISIPTATASIAATRCSSTASCTMPKRATNGISRRDQRLSVAGFYKQIDHPIEAFSSFNDNRAVTPALPMRRRRRSMAPSSKCRNISICRSARRFLGQPPRCRDRQLHLHQVEAKVRRGDTVAVYGTS